MIESTLSLLYGNIEIW